MTSENEHNPPSEAAMWHKLSGAPEGVTDDGVVVRASVGDRLQAEKQILRAKAQRLGHEGSSRRLRSLGRLAASYLLAGDVETARRYLDQAERLLDEQDER